MRTPRQHCGLFVKMSVTVENTYLTAAYASSPFYRTPHADRLGISACNVLAVGVKGDRRHNLVAISTNILTCHLCNGPIPLRGAEDVGQKQIVERAKYATLCTIQSPEDDPLIIAAACENIAVDRPGHLVDKIAAIFSESQGSVSPATALRLSLADRAKYATLGKMQSPVALQLRQVFSVRLHGRRAVARTRSHVAGRAPGGSFCGALPACAGECCSSACVDPFLDQSSVSSYFQPNSNKAGGCHGPDRNFIAFHGGRGRGGSGGKERVCCF